jgi:hypothetical protein
MREHLEHFVKHVLDVPDRLSPQQIQNAQIDFG